MPYSSSRPRIWFPSCMREPIMRLRSRCIACILLLDGFTRHKTPARTAHRLADRLGIVGHRFLL
jgi:hypothetical protein